MSKGFGGFGGGNMGNLIKQAQKMQQEMLKAQEELGEKSFEATAGGGAVKVVVNGKSEILELKISPEVVGSQEEEDVEMLQDLIIAAISEAFRKAEEYKSNTMGKLTGGMNLPGMF